MTENSAEAFSIPNTRIPDDVLAYRLDRDVMKKLPIGGLFLIGLLAYVIVSAWVNLGTTDATRVTAVWVLVASIIAVSAILYRRRWLGPRHANLTTMVVTLAFMTGVGFHAYVEGTTDPGLGMAVLQFGLATFIYRFDLAMICAVYSYVVRVCVAQVNGLASHPLEEVMGGLIFLFLIVWIIYWRRTIQIHTENYRWADIQLNEELKRLIAQLHLEIESRKMTEAQLRQKQEELSALTLRVLSIQEEERGRISRELHDELGQALTATRFALERILRAAPEYVEPLVRESMDLVQESTRQMRTLAMELRPSLLDHLGLESALQWTVDRLHGRGGAQVEFKTINGHSRFPLDVETACYRVAQEALTNSLKHAKASQIRVFHENSNSGLRVRVEDDGLGFDVEKTRGRPDQTGLGLLGMQERTRAIGGELSVRSSPQSGTVVELTVPRTSIAPKES